MSNLNSSSFNTCVQDDARERRRHEMKRRVQGLQVRKNHLENELESITMQLALQLIQSVTIIRVKVCVLCGLRPALGKQ